MAGVRSSGDARQDFRETIRQELRTSKAKSRHMAEPAGHNDRTGAGKKARSSSSWWVLFGVLVTVTGLIIGLIVLADLGDACGERPRSEECKRQRAEEARFEAQRAR